MKRFLPEMGLVLLLLGVTILCLQGFHVIPVFGNLWLVIGLIFIIVGFLFYILMNKHTKK
ncbi:MAG: hypothetical protein LUG18_08410 [Candidatus Azobacteroides sp.]|nr:hypothetical protein [Candidatus Azobacteroides sp.]